MNAEPAALTPAQQREERGLAPYAFRSAQSRGRDHAITADPWRTDCQRDRGRIVHARSFRRLQYKTQVFTNDEGDHFRTRLTHTLEVAQLARGAAIRLGLNEDLAECIALVHDVGHPPFGHRGEDLLRDLMADHGGYEHNRQGLRIVEELESPYAEHAGLNLSYEVRESIVKHSAQYDRARIPLRFRPDEAPLLEAQLADEADSLIYDCHDLDDGLRSGIIDLDQLQQVALWAGAWDEARARTPRAANTKLVTDLALRILLDSFLAALVEHSSANLTREHITDVAAVRASRAPLIALPPSMQQAKQALETWLFANLYRHHRVNRTFHTARRMLTELFQFYVAHPDSLPPVHAARADGAGLHRAVADYIAGMTDRFALEEYRAIFQA